MVGEASHGRTIIPATFALGMLTWCNGHINIIRPGLPCLCRAVLFQLYVGHDHKRWQKPLIGFQEFIGFWRSIHGYLSLQRGSDRLIASQFFQKQLYPLTISQQSLPPPD